MAPASAPQGPPQRLAHALHGHHLNPRNAAGIGGVAPGHHGPPETVAHRLRQTPLHLGHPAHLAHEHSHQVQGLVAVGGGFGQRRLPDCRRFVLCKAMVPGAREVPSYDLLTVEDVLLARPLAPG